MFIRNIILIFLIKEILCIEPSLIIYEDNTNNSLVEAVTSNHCYSHQTDIIHLTINSNTPSKLVNNNIVNGVFIARNKILEKNETMTFGNYRSLLLHVIPTNEAITSKISMFGSFDLIINNTQNMNVIFKSIETKSNPVISITTLYTIMVGNVCSCESNIARILIKCKM